MPTTALADITNIMKRLYEPRLQVSLYEGAPLLGRIPKAENFDGEDYRMSLMYSPTGGGSALFAMAQSNARAPAYAAFILTRSRDYSVIRIDGETILASQKSTGAIKSELEREWFAARHTLSRSLAISAYRNGGGARGVIASGSATTTLVLTNRGDITNFEVGMTVQSAADDGTGGAGVDAGTAVISAVDREAGSISKTGAAWNAGGFFAAADFLFRAGDYNALMTGLDAWIPATPPGATLFYGQNRSLDPTRLGGVRITATASDGTYGRVLTRAASRLEEEGGNADAVFMNPNDWRRFSNEQTDKTVIKVPAMGAKGKMIANVGYNSIVFHGPVGDMNVLSDRNCPENTVWMLQMNTWKLASLGPCPRILQLDGQPILRLNDADAYEGRIGMYGQIGCHAPGYNARINTAALAV